MIKKLSSKVERIFFYLQAIVILLGIFFMLIIPTSFFMFDEKIFSIFNLGTLVMAGFAGVFYAWSSGVEKDKAAYKRIYRSSKLALCGAISFLMRSVFEQWADNPDSYLSLLFGDHIPKILSYIFFAIGVLMFLIVFFRFFYEVFILKRRTMNE